MLSAETSVLPGELETEPPNPVVDEAVLLAGTDHGYRRRSRPSPRSMCSESQTETDATQITVCTRLTSSRDGRQPRRPTIQEADIE